MSKALKALIEKRESILDKMEGLLEVAEVETRALTDDETTEYDGLKAEVEKIDATIKRIEEKRAIEIPAQEETPAAAPAAQTEDEKRAAQTEEIKGIFEKRDAMTTTVNNKGGVVVNKELTSEIIKVLKDRSNVLGFFNMTTIKGAVKVPKKTGSGVATWEDEQLVSNTSDKATVPTLELLELGQNRLYRESAVTQQMLNMEEIDLRAFIIDDIAETMGDSIEDAVFNGDGSKKPTGILKGIAAGKKVTLAARGSISFDDIKKCKAKLKKPALMGARWFMNSDTLLALDLIKDNEGRYILQPDITQPSGYTLLGLPVEVTDVIPTLATTDKNVVIVLANPAAYHVNMQKELALYIYDDSAYKRAGLIGYGSDVYLDGKVKNDDVLAGIENPKA